MDIALAEGTPAAFGAATLCEAFQITVAARRERIALRTKGDKTAWSWTEYGDRVRRYAGGFAGLGIAAHDAVAILLVNRPEMNAVDMAAVHLGAVPFSIYASSTAAQMRHLLADSSARVIVTEQAFLAKVMDAVNGTRIEHIVVVDGDFDLEQLAARAVPGFDFEAA